MGGASTQITFIPENPESIKPGYDETLLMFGTPYHVYTYSYLCYGLNEAYSKYLAALVLVSLLHFSFKKYICRGTTKVLKYTMECLSTATSAVANIKLCSRLGYSEFYVVCFGNIYVEIHQIVFRKSLHNLLSKNAQLYVIKPKSGLWDISSCLADGV